MMNHSFGGGFTQAPVAKQVTKAEGTLPVFIKMVMQQSEDTINLYGMEYKMVTIVAVVRNINHSSTKITYDLEDLSGRISAHYWVEEEGDAPTTSNIMLNTYIRVVGAIRSQGDGKSIMIYKIHPAGINEVSTHYLEVLNARFQAEEYSKDIASFDNGTSNKMDVDSAAVAVVINEASKSESIVEGLKGKELAVFNLIHKIPETYGEAGYDRESIYRQFPHISQNEMNSMLQKMIQEGHIYTTVDDQHYQSCFK